MILQALSDYYWRKAATGPANQLPPEGFELKEIPFVLVLDQDGSLVQIEDTREVEGKRKVGRRFLVPQGVKRTSGVAANLLWDTAEHVLGIVIRGKQDRVAEQHQAFRERLSSALGALDGSDAGVLAVMRFLEHERDLDALAAHDAWVEIRDANANLSFRLHGDDVLVCQRPDVVAALQARGDERAGPQAICLVTGKTDHLERLHPAIKGIWGAQTSGANIVSFNLDAFNSYGKEQGANAPVGSRSTFAYTTALNHLLRRDSSQRLQVGDATTVFWAERQSELETGIVDIFGEPPKDDPDRNTRAVRGLYRSIESGGLAADWGATRFYVLGLAPNAARIAVRFWSVSTVAELAGRIRKHFDDLEIAKPTWAPPYPSLFRLLNVTAVQGKADNVHPNLAGDLMRSILAGLPYPATLLQATVRRCRAERDITPLLAALIKACLNRETHSRNPILKEILKVSLDPDNPSIGYRLGRLFATLEKIQEEANPGINATIRDRFYGSASSTPVSVFANLMRLKNHHLAKLENRGRVVNFERLIGEILSEIGDFPSLLPLSDQGRFAVGYYHQRQDFYSKSNSVPKDN